MKNCYSCDTPFPFVKGDFCHQCGAAKPSNDADIALLQQPTNKGYVGIDNVLVQQRGKEKPMPESNPGKSLPTLSTNPRHNRTELPPHITDFEDPHSASNLAFAASTTLKDRASERDTPKGERSMKKCVDIYKAWIGIDLTEEQGWQFMTALKMARSVQGKPKDDDYIDRAGYAALEGECALRDRV